MIENTVYAVETEKPTEINILLNGKMVESRFHGKLGDLCNMLEQSLTELIECEPLSRKLIRHAMHRVWLQTLPGVVAYWLDGWPLTILGAGAIAAIIYGLGWLLHLVGVA